MVFVEMMSKLHGTNVIVSLFGIKATVESKMREPLPHDSTTKDDEQVIK